MKLSLPWRRRKDDASAAGGGQMTIVEHLEELRRRIVISIVAIAVGLVIAFSLYDRILELLLDPYCDVLRDRGQDTEAGCDLIFTSVTEGFTTRIRVSTLIGIGFAMPVLLLQLWRFVTPALHSHEKRWAVPFVLSALVLFVLGASLAYWTLPRAFEFLLEISGENVNPLLAVGPYLSFISVMMLTFGIGFEFPILLIFMQLAGLIEPSDLGRFRRYAIVLIVVLVAVLTPSGDPISLMALSVPMYIFYEASSVIGRLLLRNRT